MERIYGWLIRDNMTTGCRTIKPEAGSVLIPVVMNRVWIYDMINSMAGLTVLLRTGWTAAAADYSCHGGRNQLGTGIGMTGHAFGMERIYGILTVAQVAISTVRTQARGNPLIMICIGSMPRNMAGLTVLHHAAWAPAIADRRRNYGRIQLGAVIGVAGRTCNMERIYGRLTGDIMAK